MKLLLVSQQEVPPGKTSRAFWTLKRLFFGMRSFVPLQVLESRKCMTAGKADMRPGLISLRRGPFGIACLSIVRRLCRNSAYNDNQSLNYAHTPRLMGRESLVEGNDISIPLAPGGLLPSLVVLFSKDPFPKSSPNCSTTISVITR